MGCGSSSAADTIENISSGRVNTKDGNEERNSRPFINKGRDTSSSKYHYDRINAQLYEDGDRKLDDDGKPALPPLKQPFRYLAHIGKELNELNSSVYSKYGDRVLRTNPAFWELCYNLLAMPHRELIRVFYDFACTHDLNTVSLVARGLVNCFDAFIAPALRSTEDYISSLDPETNWTTGKHTLAILSRVQTSLFRSSYIHAIEELGDCLFFENLTSKDRDDSSSSSVAAVAHSSSGSDKKTSKSLSMRSSSFKKKKNPDNDRGPFYKKRRDSTALLYFGLLSLTSQDKSENQGSLSEMMKDTREVERKDVNEDYMGGYEHSRSGIRFLGRGRSGGNNDYSNLDRHSDNRSNDHRNGKGAVTRGNNESESALTHPPTDLRRRASFLSGPPDMVKRFSAMQNRKQASHLEIKQRSEVQSSIKQATLSAEATDAYVTSPLSVSLGVLPCLSEALYTIYWCFSYTREVSFQKAIDLLQVPSSTSTTLPSENGSDHGFATLEERKQEEFYRIIKACSSSASSFHSHFRSAYLNRVLCKLIGAAWKGDPGMGGTDISVTNAFLTALCPGIVVLDAFTRSHIENRNKKMGESHYDNSGESGSNDRKGGMFNYTPEVEAFLNEDGIRSIDIIQYAFTQCVNCTQMSKRWSVGDDGSNTSNSDTAERYRAYMIPSLSENIIKQVADWMDKHLLIMFENNTRKEERWGLGGDRKEGVVTEEKDKDGLFKVTKDIWKNIYDAGDSDHQSLGNQKKAYVVAGDSALMLMVDGITKSMSMHHHLISLSKDSRRNKACHRLRTTVSRSSAFSSSFGVVRKMLLLPGVGAMAPKEDYTSSDANNNSSMHNYSKDVNDSDNYDNRKGNNTAENTHHRQHKMLNNRISKDNTNGGGLEVTIDPSDTILGDDVSILTDAHSAICGRSVGGSSEEEQETLKKDLLMEENNDSNYDDNYGSVNRIDIRNMQHVLASGIGNVDDKEDNRNTKLHLQSTIISNTHNENGCESGNFTASNKRETKKERLNNRRKKRRKKERIKSVLNRPLTPASADNILHNIAAPSQGDMACIFSPYFRSTFGILHNSHNVNEKAGDDDTVHISVNSVVEAGEGHGPRKEMFRLACDEVIQNTARHVGTGCLVGKKDSEIIKLTVPVSSMLVSIRPGHRLEFPYNPASASTETIKSESKADVIAETVVVASIIDDYTLRLDTPLQRTYTDEYQQHNSRCKEGTHMEKAHPPVHYLHIVDVSPLLVYQRASETFFVDPGILSTAENIYRYRYLGWLIAAALFNRCYLPLRLPTLFFKLLLKQNNQTQSSTSKGSGKEREEWGQYLHYLYSQHNHNSTSERGDSKANRGSSKLPMSVSDDRSTTDASGLKADAGCLKLRGVHYEDRVWGRYRPSLADVLMLDNSLKQSVFQIINMKDSDFKGMLDLEELPASTAKEDYILNMARSLLQEGMQWQLTAIRQGFRCGLGVDGMRMLQAMKIDATSLSQMVLGYYSQSLEDSFSDQDDDSDGKDGDEGSCKKSSSARADVQQRRRKKRSVEHAFRIVLDEDVKSYPELIESFFSVVDDKWSMKKKRLFLHFVTGVDTFPPPGSEDLVIELPFLSYGPQDHRSTLQRLPSSHTCSNTLELPNYFESLQYLRKHELDGYTNMSDADLLNRLSDILNEKLTTAIANCAGYALDELSGGNSGGGSSSGMNRSTHGSNSGGISYNNDSRSNDSNKNDKNRDKDIVLPIFASSSSSSSISSFSRREFEHTSYNDDRGIKNCDGDRSDDDGNKENDGDINNLLGITTFSSKGEGDDGDIHAALMSFAQDDSDDEIDDPARILYNMSKNDVGNDKEGANMPSGMSIGGDGGRANHNTTGVSASATQSESGGTLYQSLDVDYLPILTESSCDSPQKSYNLVDNGTRAELDLSQTNRSDRHKPQALGIKSDHSTVANVDKFDPGFSDGGGLDLNKYSSDDLDMFGDDNKYIDSTKNASRVVDDNKGRERTGELELFNRNGRNLDKFDTNGCRRKSLSPRDGYEDLMDGILNDISDDEM